MKGKTMSNEAKTIVNLTQHNLTEDQIGAGVYDIESKAELIKLLNFEEIPSPDEIIARARAIAKLVKQAGATQAMIGGAPFLMPVLETALIRSGIKPLYAFTKREIVEGKEIKRPDGSVVKPSVFRHAGFVDVEQIREAIKREGIEG
jgi:hypothetical protein